MIVFCVICALMILVALGSSLPPLRRTGRIGAGTTVAEANAAVYRRQIAESESDLGHGLITRAQFEQDRRELERRAIVDLPAEAPRSSSQRAVASDTLVVYLAIAIPVAAIAVYLALGAPEAIWR
jgi:cytochrome c-type biogenesis protein CcmH